MQKTPDDVKLSIECCINERCVYDCIYYEKNYPDCQTALIRTMNEYIHQLEAERDAAVKELKRIGKCVCCKHDKLCTFIFPNCVECEKTDCPCHTCEYRSNWEWRGVPKEE